MKIEHLEKYSKRALIRAYLCAHSEGQSGCPAGGGEHCKMMKGCRKVTPADWWNDDVLPEYKDFTPVQLAERCRRGACPVENGCCPFWPTPDGWCCLVTDQMAATPGPWEAWQYNAAFLGKGGQGIVTRISTRPLDPDDEVIKVADSSDITAFDAAYIVAACNAVPRLVEMVKFLSEEASGDAGYLSDDIIWTPEEKLQEAYQATEPKE